MARRGTGSRNDRWADKYRTPAKKGTMLLCKTCTAPNRHGRAKCWKCGSEDLTTRGYKSGYWHELRRREDAAFNSRSDTGATPGQRSRRDGSLMQGDWLA